MSTMIIGTFNHLETVAELAQARRWDCERIDDTQLELYLDIKGAELLVRVTDLCNYDGLHFAFIAEKFKVPKRRHYQMRKMLGFINERLWVGHFDLYPEKNQVMYRHALLLAGQEAVSASCEAVMTFGRTNYERYLVAFVMLAKGAGSIEEALQSATFDTDGSA